MPELPEVEGTRRRLAPLIVGQKITGLDARDRKLWQVGAGLTEEDALNRVVRSLDRRAKVFIFGLEGDLVLLLHLKIAGQVVYVGPEEPDRWLGGHPYPLIDETLPGPSTRFVLEFEGGGRLFVNDQRRFCWLRLLLQAEADAFLAEQKYGPDPLDDTFTPALLAERLQARKGRALKTALLDQTCIAGLGNIYADESLHRARLHPELRAGDVTSEQAERLHHAIADVLALAVPVSGAIVKIGRAIDDPASGRDFLLAHGRAGEPCRTCGQDHIIRTVVGSRGTYYCPTCQPAPGSADRS